MNRYMQGSFRLLTLTLLLVFAVALFASACEPGGEPIIANQRSEDIRIYVTLIWENGPPFAPNEEIDYGVVPARTTRKLASITFVSRSWVRRIQAKDTSGKVVFSHDYNMDGLDKIGWKITIPASGGP